MAYNIGDHIKIKPETVELGFAPTGIVDNYMREATSQYRVLFSDGTLRWLHENQIAGIVGE